MRHPLQSRVNHRDSALSTVSPRVARLNLPLHDLQAGLWRS